MRPTVVHLRSGMGGISRRSYRFLGIAALWLLCWLRTSDAWADSRGEPCLTCRTDDCPTKPNIDAWCGEGDDPLARNVAPSEIERRTADRLKTLPKYEALFFSEGQRQPVHLHLTKSG